jgi:hypothetical protein
VMLYHHRDLISRWLASKISLWTVVGFGDKISKTLFI